MKKITLIFSFTTLSFGSFAKQHWIIFFAYPHRSNVPGYENSKAGHTYVSFITRDDVAKQTIVDEIWGFHPVNQSLKAVFKAEKGEMKSEAISINNKPGTESILAADYDFVVEIKDDIIYQNCRRVKDVWNKADYSVIASQTCVDYAKNVASRIGNIIIPNTTLSKFPKDFLLQLKKQNQNIDKRGRETLSLIPKESHTTNGNNSETSNTSNNSNSHFIIDKNHKPYKYALFYVTSTNQLALLGKHPIGINVTVLNNKTGKSIFCKTTAVKKYKNEFTGDAVATTLDKLIYAKNPEEHSFTAILSTDKRSFQMIDRILIGDKVKNQNVDNSIKQGGYLEKLLNQYDEAKSATDYLKILTSKKPVIYHLNISGAAINVVTYMISEYEVGPRFIELNSKIIPLSGQCSFLDFQVYKYGSNYFIKSNSGACETGYIIVEIFEIREGSVIKEFSDSGYSN